MIQNVLFFATMLFGIVTGLLLIIILVVCIVRKSKKGIVITSLLFIIPLSCFAGCWWWIESAKPKPTWEERIKRDFGE